MNSTFRRIICAAPGQECDICRFLRDDCIQRETIERFRTIDTTAIPCRGQCRGVQYRRYILMARAGFLLIFISMTGTIASSGNGMIFYPDCYIIGFIMFLMAGLNNYAKFLDHNDNRIYSDRFCTAGRLDYCRNLRNICILYLPWRRAPG